METFRTLPLNILLIICMLSQAAVQHCTSISSVEVDALLKFKSLIKGGKNETQQLLGWSAGNAYTVCELWAGVTCSSSGGSGDHVEGINLAGFGLAGSLAPQLGNLSFMSILNLSRNSFTGIIPSELARCASLKVLDLRSNMLTGPIPSSLSSLSFLHEALRLWKNNLTGGIPSSLANCTNLTFLDLSSNQLTGPIPTGLGMLRRLQHLFLFENYFTGAIPSSLGNCTSLTDISVYTNQISGSIPAELGLLPSLQILFLTQNNLVGPIPSSLGNCTDLYDLELPENQLSGSIPAELGMLQHRLRFLFLWQNNLVGPIPSSLGNCTSLSDLELQGNQLSGSIPSELGMLLHLSFLFLSVNHLSGLIELNLSNFTSLLELNLSSNQLSGSLPTELGQLQQLQSLDLGKNNFSSEIPWEHLSNCSFLYYLDLSNNQLSGGIPSSIGKLQALRNLYLKGNLLRGVIPDLVGSHLSLLDVDLSFNQFNGSLPSSLAAALSNLDVSLDLSHNYFTGSLPSWLGQLVMVQVIDLSDNNFVSTIPGNLGDCVNLIGLYLSHNHLFGVLPGDLLNLSNLETLDLSRNNLTGMLPSFLGNLHNLQFLNVSFNSFTGGIPTLGVFKHLNASSFLGNPGLCGPIIQKQCIQTSKKHHHHNQLNWPKVILAIALPLSIIGASILLLALLWCSHHHPSQNVEVFMSLAGARRYTSEELMKATQGYSELNLLGQGGLSLVYKGVLSNDNVVAVKKLKDVCSYEALLREMQVLSKLRHRNLVRILGCVLNLEVKALVLEYMSNGSLEHYWHHDSESDYGLSWEMFMRIAIGVANGLTYLHHDYDVPIIHGDVKPSNILLDSDFEAHLGDFGLAKLITNPDRGGTVSISSNFKGSIGYMAPEYGYTTRITTKVDVYSYGVVILEMLTRKRPTQIPGVSLHEWVKSKDFHGVELEEVLDKSLLDRCSQTLSSDSNKRKVVQILKMALDCTENHPNDRPTMKDVVEFLLNIERDHAVMSSLGSSQQ